MKNDWLTTSSFERVREVISAINVLSIHAKLRLAGVENPVQEAEVQQAKQHLQKFLQGFQTLIQNAEQNNNGTIIGGDPRLSDLAMRYLAQKKHLSQQTSLYNISFDTLAELIETESPDNLPELISCLKDLRSLVEQHAYTDVVNLLGDM